MQYQEIAAPLTTAQPLETASGWQRQQPGPTLRRGIAAALTVAACALVPVVSTAATVPDLAWSPTVARTQLRAAPRRPEGLRVAPVLPMRQVVAPSRGLYADQQADPNITTLLQYRTNDAGVIAAYQRAEVNGSQHVYETQRHDELCPTGASSRDYTLFDRFVANTTKPIAFQIDSKYRPSDMAAVSRDDPSYIAALTALVRDLVARANGRIIAFSLGNEIDEYLEVDPVPRVAEYTGMMTAMTPAVKAAAGQQCLVYTTFTGHCQRDGSYDDNGYAAIALAGTDPAFTSYPTDQDTSVVYDFNAADPDGLAADFDRFHNATGSPRPFIIAEGGCPSGAIVTAGAPGGGGQATQQAWVSTVTTLLTAYGPTVKLFTFTYQNDQSPDILNAQGFYGPAYTNFRDFIGSIGYVDYAGNPKLAYPDVVTFLGGTIGSSQTSSVPLGAWKPTHPTLTMRRTLSAAQQQAQGLVQVVVPPVVETNGGIAPATGSVPLLQYQGLAAPFASGATQDGLTQWFQQGPEPTRRPIAVTHAPDARSAPPFALDAPPSLDTSVPWYAQQPDPVRRPASIALRVLAQPRVPITTAGAVAETGGRSVAVGSILFLQYQALATPFDSGTPAEVQIAWLTTQLPRVSRHDRARAHFYPAFTADTVLTPTPAVVPPAAWAPQAPDVVARRASRLTQGAALVGDIIVTPPSVPALSWTPQFRDRARERTSPAPYIPGQSHFGVTVSVPVMSWTGRYLEPPVRLRPRHQTRPSLVMPFDAAIVTPVSWHAQYADLIPRVPDYTAAKSADGIEPHYLADVTVQAPAASWRPLLVERLILARVLPVAHHQALAIDPQWTAPAAVVVPALPISVYPSIVRGVRPPVAEGLSTPLLQSDDIADTAGFAWTPVYPLQIVRQGMAAQPFTAEIASQTARLGWVIATELPVRAAYPRAAYTWAQPHFGVTVLVPVLSWQPVSLDYTRLRKEIARATIPSVFGDARLTAPDVVTAPDLSIAVYPAQVRGRVLHAARMPASVMDPQWTAPAFVAAPPLSAPVYPSRVPRRAPLVEAPAWFSQPFTADVTEPVPGVVWAPVMPAFILRERYAAAAQQALGAPIYVADVTQLPPDLWSVVYPDRIDRAQVPPHGYLVGTLDPAIFIFIRPTADVVIKVRPDVRTIIVRPDIGEILL